MTDSPSDSPQAPEAPGEAPTADLTPAEAPPPADPTPTLAELLAEALAANARLETEKAEENRKAETANGYLAACKLVAEGMPEAELIEKAPDLAKDGTVQAVLKLRHDANKNTPAPVFAQPAPVSNGRTVQALYTLARYTQELEGLICRYTGHDRTVLNATLDKVTGRAGGALGLYHERAKFIAAGPTNDAAQTFANGI